MSDISSQALPPGWERKVSDTGRVTYKSSRIVVKSLKSLRQFHEQGRFQELTEAMVVFGKQKRRNFSNEGVSGEPEHKRAKEPNEISNEQDLDNFQDEIDNIGNENTDEPGTELDKNQNQKLSHELKR